MFPFFIFVNALMTILLHNSNSKVQAMFQEMFIIMQFTLQLILKEPVHFIISFFIRSIHYVITKVLYSK